MWRRSFDFPGSHPLLWMKRLGFGVYPPDIYGQMEEGSATCFAVVQRLKPSGVRCIKIPENSALYSQCVRTPTACLEILKWPTYSTTTSQLQPLHITSSSRRSEPLCLLERIPNLRILPQPDLFLLFRVHVLHPYFPDVLFLEFPDEDWVPELACNAQIFTAAEEGVGFAAFGCGGDAIGGEVVLLAAGDGDESIR